MSWESLSCLMIAHRIIVIVATANFFLVCGFTLDYHRAVSVLPHPKSH